MIGTPYEYGTYLKPGPRGKSVRQAQDKPRGVDCSSLIQYIYSRAGIDLPRSSILQATKGKEVRGTKNLRVGDLIFFETTKGHYWHSVFNGKKIYIGHVVLYLGNGKIIDTSEDRNNGHVAKVKLRELTKLPGYSVTLIKRILGENPPRYKLPAYSQFLDIKDKGWEKRACGIVSLKMVLDFWSKKAGIKYPPVDELIKKYHRGAYINKIGWSHKGLARIARRYGLKGENCDWAHYSTKDALALLETKLAIAPVIASIHKNLNPALPGHLVVITEIKKDKIFYNDPDSKTRNKIKRSASLKQFLKGWKRRVIVIKP